ncbi:MAG: M56 family metallopeptidase [Muribaculaceae bacterium]|nr:M56 family metallopeptidase [Muribaculaceae bacterium]MDE7142116.1 M56 family metallopeptidase [Muribaculaceae bacterium]
MGTLFSYSLGSGIFLLAGFLVYRLLMAGEKQPGLNRAALLGLYAASLAALPLMALLRDTRPAPVADVPAVSIGRITLTVAAEQPAPSILPDILLWVYAAGVAAVLLHSAVGFARLAAIIRSGRRVARDGHTLVVVPHNCVPFSFAGYIVMGEADAARGDSMITTHELGHLRHRHWLDLLLAQAVCALMWYNPAAWLARAELRRVHEYQADSAVIARGVNLREYQMLLIEKAAGVRLQSIANSLDHSNLSKRITMMYKQSNRASRRLRALALAPALLLAAAAVDTPAVASALSAAAEATLAARDDSPARPMKTAPTVSGGKSTEKSDEPQAAVAVMPEFPGGLNEMMKFLATNIHYPEAAMKSGAQGRVVVKFVVKADGTVADPEILRGQTPELDAEALRVVGSMPAWTPGRDEKGNPVSCYFTIPVSFALSGGETEAAGTSGNARSGKSTPSERSSSTTTTTTTTTSTNGVVTSITETRTDGTHITLKMDDMSLESDPAAARVNLNVTRYEQGAADAPACFVDGKPLTGPLSELKPDRIKSISVMKNDPAYPNGKILISTK